MKQNGNRKNRNEDKSRQGGDLRGNRVPDTLHQGNYNHSRASEKSEASLFSQKKHTFTLK